MVVFVIDDDIHCDLNDRFPTFELALADLRRRAQIPWDQEPNRAPCKQWRTCGRRYVVMEIEKPRGKPSKVLQRVIVLEVSSRGVQWAEGFEG
jgi:hypothetical protein